ncbi:ABC transporter substrate-binding protein [Pseudohoeflea coraliihabitans]|uniref:PotD/PotF family extracellular solute-binding protein n=1 Tax=Pseudohoeflea coraliihabitans TaxID=2860393 RepID=A0ABS6WPX7_9HYPH|nr:PotD/PotF family extracellular solute-binding protein [Pseudohoeflea sp. DP4N28-3]MBW3098034.1 PotD/PotF family extracellular solute-binding protein [Pseudohoeflea sp. DP4N28-3]
MKDKFSTTSQLELTRRTMLRAAGGLAGAAALTSLPGMSGVAQAATATVNGYGVTTAQLKDWSVMTDSIGVEMDFAGTNNSVGVFLRDVVASQLGDEVDIFIFESGTEDILGPQGVYLPIDESHPELSLWERTSDDWKRSAVVQDPDGNQWGVPVIGNADSFGYFPDKLGVDADSDEEISWSVMFEDDNTRGRVAYDQTWTYSLGPAALYLQGKGDATFGDIANLTRDEAKMVVDFLIERKKAGQFRTLHSAFEEQVQLLANKEVDVINCWEPAVREANLKLGDGATKYAYTKEGYFKWGHGAYIASQAKDRDNLDQIYKVLNYFLGGEYRALQARDRGYAGPNMDLGVAYAEEQGWSEEEIAALKATEAKVNRKFAKPYVSTTTPSNADVMEEEWQRFLNA